MFAESSNGDLQGTHNLRAVRERNDVRLRRRYAASDDCVSTLDNLFWLFAKASVSELKDRIDHNSLIAFGQIIEKR
jgi:hypothetical protein